jgi:hypothetical protein
MQQTIKFLIRLFAGGLSVWFGMIKLNGGQFTPTSVKIENIKNVHSPEMVFLFFGNSGLYIWIIGWFQLLGGLLLVNNKTQIIGAIICLVIFSNIMIINYSFHFNTSLVIFMSIPNICCILTLVFERKRLTNLLI